MWESLFSSIRRGRMALASLVGGEPIRESQRTIRELNAQIRNLSAERQRLSRELEEARRAATLKSLSGGATGLAIGAGLGAAGYAWYKKHHPDPHKSALLYSERIDPRHNIAERKLVAYPPAVPALSSLRNSN